MGHDNQAIALSEKRGNAFGVRFFQWFMRIGGLNRACEFVWVVAIYYLLFDREAVRAIMPYINHRFPTAGRRRRLWYAYRVFVSNGQAMLTCAANVAGHGFKKKFVHREEVLDYLRTGSHGMIIITSHFGNWQMAMKEMMEDLGRPVNFLMRPEHNQYIKTALKHNPNAGNLKVIPIDNEFGGMFEVLEALQRNEIVCIMGDRAVSERYSQVDFFNAEAYFPFTAFFLAARISCPVVPVFVISENHSYNRLTIKFGTLIKPQTTKAARENNFQEYVQQYVSELEAQAVQHPFQCYMFHNSWQAPAKPAAAHASGNGSRQDIKLTIFRAALLITAVSILVLATIPGSQAQHFGSHNDKVNHSLAFFVLSWLTSLSFPKRFNLKSCLLLAGFGLLIECIQYFLPSRSFSLYDLLTDVIAIALFYLFYHSWKYYHLNGKSANQEEH